MSSNTYEAEKLLLQQLQEFNFQIIDFCLLRRLPRSLLTLPQLKVMIDTIIFYIKLFYGKITGITDQNLYISLYVELKELEQRLTKLSADASKMIINHNTLRV